VRLHARPVSPVLTTLREQALGVHQESAVRKPAIGNPTDGPHAAICLDPFHAVAIAAIAAKALDTTRREQWARVRKVDPDAAKTLKGTRFVLLKNPENHSYTQW
jgi:hypothetical protein